MKREDCTRVFLVRGIVAHLLAPHESASGNHMALCGTSPGLIAGVGRYWRGTGSQGEYEHAADLPLCVRCTDALEKYGQ